MGRARCSKMLGGVGILLVICFCCLSAQGKVIYVDADAAGADDGTSWENAYNFLQDALAEANSSAKPADIRVAQGVYTPDSNSAVPDGTGVRTATFQLINGVSIEGGYAGFGESDPDVRDPRVYETILSGDLNGNDVEIEDPLDLEDEGTRYDNSYHVVIGSGMDPSAILDGLTITAGRADDRYVDHHGGGMYNVAGSPTLVNCTFRGNLAQYGGGMRNVDGSPILTDCVFSGNLAFSGGGMEISGGSPKLADCIFIGNATFFDGGGMLNYTGSPTLTNCTFTRNLVTDGRGGGLRTVHGSPTLTNCTFSGNSASGDSPIGGGGVDVAVDNLTLTNCTFSGNSGCGMFKAVNSTATVTNCIFWGDTPGEIYFDGNMPVITYSNVQGGWAGVGNIDEDPCFADADGNDYHLKSQAGRYDGNIQTWIIDDATSPCIDAGDPMSPVGAEAFPNGGVVNIGRYGGTIEASKSYFGKPPCETIVTGDINGDCEVDFLDFRIMALHWCESDVAEPTLTYQVDKCFKRSDFQAELNTEATRFSVEVQGSYIHFEDIISTNCCSDRLELRMTLEDDLIVIFEDELVNWSMCQCVCGSSASATLGPFEDGTYGLDVYKRNFNYAQEFSTRLVGSTIITIGPG